MKKEPTTKTCVGCAKTFTTYKANTKRYCSKACRREHTEVRSDKLSRRDKTQTGAVSELLVCVDLLRRGFKVFRNVAGSGVDLMTYRSGQALRIEVKTTIKHQSTHKVYIPPVNKGYCEVIALVLAGDNVVYIEAETRSVIELGA